MSRPTAEQESERRYLRDITDQLRLEGWSILTESNDPNIRSLFERQVDFIARRGSELLVGEVASRTSARREKIDRLAREVAEIPNARLQVYWLGDAPADRPDFSQIERYIKEAIAVADVSPQAGFLMALAAVEGAIAAFADRVNVKSAAPSQQLISNLYSLGYLDESDFSRLKSLYRLRSRIAHLATPEEPERDDIQFVLNLADRMLNNRYASADEMVEWFLDRYQRPAALHSPDPGENDRADAGQREPAELLHEAFPYAPVRSIADAVGDLRQRSQGWTRKSGHASSSMPVPWVTIPADLIELIVAVLLAQRDARAMRIRPSQGDGGMDIVTPANRPGYIDVYQVKSFATGLNASQKRQIRESLIRARDTHNDPGNGILIDTWLLTLPLDPTREQLEWIAEEAASLDVPFAVEWRGYAFLEGLAADYPHVIDYYLRGGKSRLEDTIKALRDLAQLPASGTGAAVEPADIVPRLQNIFEALNREDPHYRYDFEVTSELPVLFARPYLVASATEGEPGRYITFHVYARYPDATDDRPIPVSFSVSREQLTPEAMQAVDDMLRYGTPVEVPAAAITNLNVDMPAGLGLANARGTVALGPWRSDADQPSRVAWAVVSAADSEPLARLIFQMDAPTRGVHGGLLVRGNDSTGVVAATIRIDPPDIENPTISISLTIIDPVGKPVRQVLPGLRFVSKFLSPNRLAFGPEYGNLRIADELPLPSEVQAIPPLVIEYVEALNAISSTSGEPINLPDIATLTSDDYQAILGIAGVLRGDRVPVTWSSVTARIRPGVVTPEQAAVGHQLMTEQDLIVSVGDTQHKIGRAFTYLLSARISVNSDAEPSADGTVSVTIVPEGSNNRAIMTTQALSPEDAQRLASDLFADN